MVSALSSDLSSEDILGDYFRWISIPSRGSSNTLQVKRQPADKPPVGL